MKVILVGNGYFGSLYRERIMRHDKYELVGVVDTDYSKLKTLSGMTIGESYKTLANNVKHDAVIICTTPEHHTKLSLKAMKRGKHVLCMKPGMMSLTDHLKLYEASVENNVAWIIDYTQRNAPEHGFIEGTILSLGNLDSISFSRHVVTPPKPEGIILDLLPHDVAAFNHSLWNYRDTTISCVVDGVKATATICDAETNKQVAFFSASYNSTYPLKAALFRVAPYRSKIANPRIELAWEQNQKFVEIRSQGRSIEINFRHEPDMITRTLNDFVSRCKYSNSNHFVSGPIMRVLHAMQHSANMNGAPINYEDLEA